MDYMVGKDIDRIGPLNIFVMIWAHIRAKLDTGTKNDITRDGIVVVLVPAGPLLTHSITNTNIGAGFSEEIVIVHNCQLVLSVQFH